MLLSLALHLQSSTSNNEMRNIFLSYLEYRYRDSSGDIVTVLRAARQRNLFSITWRPKELYPPQSSNQRPNQPLPRALCLEVKRQWRESNHSPPSSAELNTKRRDLPSTSSLQGVMLRQAEEQLHSTTFPSVCNEFSSSLITPCSCDIIPGVKLEPGWL
jgi:hypothetical protein